MRMSKFNGRILTIILMSLIMVTSIGLVGHHQGVTTLEIDQSLSSKRIFAQGIGVEPRETTVTLELTAPSRVSRLQADIVLVIDRSASFPVERAIEAANSIIEDLGTDDRIGIVSFGSDVRLDVPLTSPDETGIFQEAFDELRADGRTEIGNGMIVATDHLVNSFYGRDDAEKIQILLTDGVYTPGSGSTTPMDAAQDALDRNVLVYAIEIGTRVNRQLLKNVTELTGGRSFITLTDTTIDQILRISVAANQPVVRDVRITAILNREFEYERAFENPPNSTRNNEDGTTTLVWLVGSLDADEDWRTEYSVSGKEIGEFELYSDESYISYLDVRNRALRPDLPNLTIEVKDRPPSIEANFSFEPQDPSTFDQIEFIDESELEDGQIVEWLWEFGDFGDDQDEDDQTTSRQRMPTFRYEDDGTYEVTLTVTSDEGARSTFHRTITVFTPIVSVRRTINTYIPDDESIPGQQFQVTLDIRINTEVNGFGIYEQVPGGWNITPVHHTPANFRPSNNQWLFHETFDEATELQIIYYVDVPLLEGPEGVPDLIPNQVLSADYKFSGSVISASPVLDEEIIGETDIKISRGFPLRVVVAHWDFSGTEKLDLKGNPEHLIDDAQWGQAKQWWENGALVSFSQDRTGNPQVITFDKMNEITAYYLTQTSVFEELPETE